MLNLIGMTQSQNYDLFQPLNPHECVESRGDKPCYEKKILYSCMYCDLGTE